MKAANFQGFCLLKNVETQNTNTTSPKGRDLLTFVDFHMGLLPSKKAAKPDSSLLVNVGIQKLIFRLMERSN